MLVASGSLGSEDYKFDRISIEQGLGASMIMCFIQDSVGYVWVGTSDGLSRYDGYSFATYRHAKSDPHSLSNNFVTDIAEDRDGNLWVGTEKGLNYYDRANDRFIRYDAETQNPMRPSVSDIMLLKFDHNGNLWVGSRNRGINVLLAETGKFLRISKEGGDISGLAHDGITAIDVDDNGEVWVMCWSRTISIFNWETRSFRYLDISIEYPGKVVGFVKPDDDHYWFGTNKGLLIYNSKTGEQESITGDLANPRSLPANKIHCLFEDSHGLIWIGTENGVAVYKEGENGFHVIRHDPKDPNSLSINLVRIFMEDRAGAIWIGTRGKGINIYSPTKYKFQYIYEIPEEQNSLRGNYVYTIHEDTAGYIWIGTYEGYLNRMDPRLKTFSAFDLREINQNTGIDALIQWSDTEILAGNNTGKIHLYDMETGRLSTAIDTHDLVSDLIRSSDGKLYVALRSRGLEIYERNSYGAFTLEMTYDNSAFYSPRLVCLYETDKHIWIGSEKGLHRLNLDTGRIRTFSEDDNDGALQNDYITSFLQTSDGTFWVGTRGGLSKFLPETNSFKTYTRSEELPNDVIYSMLEDEQGMLWIGTNEGLIHWNPDTGTLIMQYLQEDGLQSNEFNTGACYKLRSGTMCFGGVNGVSYFRPDEIQINKTPPPVVITSFTVFGKQYQFDEPLYKLESIELPHDKNYIGLEFAALDFISPSQNQYSYRMTGVDHDWVEAGNRNFVSYNLNPGRYVFQVRGSNSDGIWNNAGAILEINIQPPFWGTIWFRTLAIFLGIVIIWGLFLIRTYNVRKQRDTLRKEVALRTKDLKTAVSELESFSYTVSHDLRAPLRNLQGFCELLNEDFGNVMGDKGDHYIARIIENASRMEDIIEDILWLSRASNNEIVSIKFDLSEMAKSVIDELSRHFPERAVETHVEENITVHGDKRLIRLVMENLIGNAWKFTSGKDPARIKLFTKKEHGQRIIALSDNGIGFEQKYEEKIFEPFQKLHTAEEFEGTGIGLSTVKKVVTRHGGRIWAISEPDSGSTFYFTLPDIG